MAEPRPRPTRAQRRRALIGSVRGAADAVVPAQRREAPSALIWPVRRSVGRLTAALCQLRMPLGRACALGSRGGRYVRCAIGSWGGRRPSMGGYVTGTRATDGATPAGGVHVDYPLAKFGDWEVTSR